MKQYLTVGATLAGVALLEAALLPGVVIGAAAVLAPKLFPAGGRRRPRPPSNATAGRPLESAVRRPDRVDRKAPPAAADFAIDRAIAKTATFQVIFTTVDFTAHYMVLGDLAVAAGLSASHFVIGPVLYLPHEAAWNYFSPPPSQPAAPDLLTIRPAAGGPSTGRQGLPISRAFAKTVTFRTVATAAEFTAHYAVAGNLATAAALSAFGFVAGPFIYLGHEMAWDYFGSPRARPQAPPAPARLAPA